MTEYIDRTISILEDATKHLSDGNNMLCAMAIGRAIATLDAQRCASPKPANKAVEKTIETNYLFKKDAQTPFAYPAAVQAQESIHAVELPTAPKCDEEDEGDLSNITVEDIKEFSKMKKLMASMEIIDAMKSRISGLCSKISEGVKDRLQNRRTPSYKPFYYIFMIQKL